MHAQSQPGAQRQSEMVGGSNPATKTRRADHSHTAKFTREVIKHFKESWARLLRNKFVRNWRGGFYTLEVTNEGKGWHLHLHALIDADWIDAGELAKVWNFCNRGTGYIVKVKDAREQNYLAEVTKYAVKGSDLAAWSASDIADFIDAWGKLDTFGVFGSIRGQQAEWRKVLDEQGRVTQALRVRLQQL